MGEKGEVEESKVWQCEYSGQAVTNLPAEGNDVGMIQNVEKARPL